MTKTKTFLLLLAFLLAIFATLCVKIATGEEELMFSDADVEEIVLTQDEDDLINTVRLVYKWDECYQGTTTCDNYKAVRMTATIKR